ncbi:replicative DNA helicase [Salmonella enterica]|uniref:Replicative DNA helicase n=2 Tax=Salmonella enterica TaxID=28901 RepID=A0A629KCP5_SALER|nr:replicative DNA helicase [Salmonella enterica]EBV5863144.1 replicative DNA helicase [Salmonella enterica subsp. enterica serovar Bere]ECI0840461.1 replicative DNA helicase [Salmonella enterica subsp. diarizonae]EBC7336953.1 replicative DNA helicase [Salmonella enterica]EBE9033874.1 replicative DNA helicase [Salmonella enterica]
MKPHHDAPYHQGAETSVLGGLMLDNDRWDEVAPLLTSTDFYISVNQLIYRETERLVSAGYPIDLITLSESLERRGLLERCGGFAYLAELSKNTPSAANIVAYAEIVRECSRARRLMKLGSSLYQQAALLQPSDGKGISTLKQVTDSLVEQGEKELFNLAQQNVPQACLSITTQASDVMTWLESVADGAGVTGVPTGFAELDAKTCGWQNGDLILIGARPSMGKTALAVEHALAALYGCPVDRTVQFYSIEMPASQLMLRLMSILARVPLTRLRSGNLTSHDLELLCGAVGTLSQWENRFLIDDTSYQTPATLRTSARRNARKYGEPALILVDYLQLMVCPEKKENRTQEIQEISRSLKALAKEMRCPVIALSQLNRGLEQRADKRPNNGDLRDSGSLEQDADVIIFLYRDEAYNENTLERGVAELILGKQRQGPLGTVKARYEGEYTRFSEYHLGYGGATV